MGLASLHDTGYNRAEVAAFKEHLYSATVVVSTTPSYVSLVMLWLLLLSAVTFLAPRGTWVWNMVCSNNEKLAL